MNMLITRNKHIIPAMIFGLMLSTPVVADVDVAQQPLYLGGNVPGSLMFTPSVEWPTIVSVANLGDYSPDIESVGYFDSNKCYSYQHSATDADRHFYPVSASANRKCPGLVWSGNFLNWAATQTIDPFRSALTGGYRVKDTATETWLEKARHTGQGGTGIYPNRRIPASGDNTALVNDATPFAANWIQMRIEGLGNRMRFRLNDDNVNETVTDYDTPAAVLTDRAYQLSVRVKVCDAAVGLESNCNQYQSGWKPEGTIQQYARDIRYGVFGYLNHSTTARDGAALRAKSKFVGPRIPAPGADIINTQQEWDPDTGVLIQNPNPADAAATSGTTINDSGVINYLNKFGQMTTGNHKGFDPVSELYYAAIRYYKNLGNVPEYSNLSGTVTERYNLADGFPVITSWDDPITNWCQSNVILGIGDIYTHRDKNLPGNTIYRSEEPTMPAAVAADNTVNVLNVTNMVGQLEGLGNIANTNEFTGRLNSAYMAGLAYHSNVTDIRPDLQGKATVSTYWVDVLEAQSLEGMARNQFALTAKYGGVRVPDGYEYGDAIEESWWHTNGQTLTPFGPRGGGQAAFKRPDNYFVAGQAKDMVESLQQAFANIMNDQVSSASAIAANSTRLDSETYIYQARFDSRDWTGNLLAYQINTDGSVGDVVWEATNEIPSHASRNIFTFNGTSGLNFNAMNFSSLTAAQQGYIQNINVLNYLRGDSTNEIRNGGTFRNRNSLFGDIVNSDPWFVGSSSFGYGILPDAEGEAYINYINSALVKNRTPMIYVGANDGMLHGINAGKPEDGGGTEVFAYVPKAVYHNLASLSHPNYTHKYFVDGAPRGGDVYIDIGGGKEWRTILVGSVGAGGRGVYALDVTDPDNFSASNVLWEFGPCEGPSSLSCSNEVGELIGQPSIVRLADGRWGVIFGNGYNSDSHTASVFIVDAETGELIRRFGSTSSVQEAETAVNQLNSNGMAAPIVVDVDGDRIADRIYAGDLHGNLWRYDIDDSNSSNWESPWSSGGGPNEVPLSLYRALDRDGVAQPITGKPQVGRADGGYFIYFGTGKYFSPTDHIIPVDPQVQTFYGIKDLDARVTNRADLLEQEITHEFHETFQDGDGNTYPWDVRVVSNNPIGAEPGWLLDLIPPPHITGEGERVVSMPLLWRDRIIIVTLIPDPDPCNFGGTGWLMEIDPKTGGRLGFSVFDLNRDGSFDDGEYVEIDDGAGGTIRVPVSGIRSNEGIIKTPGVISADGVAFKYTSGSTGEIEVIENSGETGRGRQSWNQLR